MPTIVVKKRKGHRAKIEQTRVQRDWMDNTIDRHAYKCFPVSLVNSIGFSISFLDDIEFVWDGISDTSPNHVKILQGKELCSTDRGNATISFHSDMIFKTDKNVSMLSIVPPNFFIDGAMPFTSLMSTSFYDETLPIAWRITRPNTNILIPAGTPVITLIPISLGELSNFELNVYDKEENPEEYIKKENKMKEWKRITDMGKWTNFYRDAVDYQGNKIGEHEVKSLVLKVNDYTTKEKD